MLIAIHRNTQLCPHAFLGIHIKVHPEIFIASWREKNLSSSSFFFTHILSFSTKVERNRFFLSTPVYKIPFYFSHSNISVFPMKDDHNCFSSYNCYMLLHKSQVGDIIESKNLFAASILATQFLAREKMEGFRSDSECLQFSFSSMGGVGF